MMATMMMATMMMTTMMMTMTMIAMTMTNHPQADQQTTFFGGLMRQTQLLEYFWG